MEPTQKSARVTEFLDDLGNRTAAIKQQICVICDQPALEFKDALSVREYRISGMCQKCQDGFFLPAED